MRPRRRDSRTCAMQRPGLHTRPQQLLMLLLLLLEFCSAAPHGGGTPIADASPEAEALSHPSDGRPTTARPTGAEELDTAAWSTGPELTTLTAATAGDTAPPTTTTDLPWPTRRDQEGTTTATTGDDRAEAAATTQTWTEWTTRPSTLPTGALGGLEESSGATAEAVTDLPEDGDRVPTLAGAQCRDCAAAGGEPTEAAEAEPLQTEATLAPGPGAGAEPSARPPGYGPANPYDHFDSDSEEQEFEVEMEHHPQAPQEEEGVEVEGQAPWLEYEDPLGPGAAEGPPATTQRSYLLQLAGNSTIVMLRRSDFAKYLKLNLAARLSLEYDNVKVNRVLLEPPRLLVNVSVVTPEGGGGGGAGAAGGGGPLADQQEEPLHALAEANATLLELSGEEYHVVRMLPLRARQPPRDDGEEGELGDAEAEAEAAEAERFSGGELAAYCLLGGACALAAAAALLLVSARHLRGLAHCLLGGGGGGGGGTGGEALLQSFLAAPWRDRPATAAHAPAAGAPAVIYSGSLADATACWTPAPPQSPPPPPPRLLGRRPAGLLLPPTRQPPAAPAGLENPAYRE